MRLIDADALKKEIFEHCRSEKECLNHFWFDENLISLVDNAPTTCAIDRRYFSYGDLFYVPSEDRVYIAEDTGSAVKGLHIDLFQNSMSEVRGYNTRYETIYRCEFEEYEVILSNYDIREQINYYYFGKRGNV